MADQLRPIAHPGQSETLVHFTGRARQDFAPEVQFLNAAEILDVVVCEQRLLARPPYGSTVNTVCFSESDIAGVEALLALGQFAGWGVVMRRDWLWAVGGGPAWYVRDDVWQPISQSGDQELLKWMVRTGPHSPNWLHEREWRIPTTSSYVDFPVEAVRALLVSDPNWEPHGPVDVIPGHPLGPGAVIELTNTIAGMVPRWYWNGSKIEVLEPITIGERLVGYI